MKDRSMPDPRFDKLADVLVNYSVRVQPGEYVLVDSAEAPDEFVVALMRAVSAAGGNSFTQLTRPRVSREFLLQINEEQTKLHADVERMRMEHMDAYIAVRGSSNVNEASGIPPEKMKIYEEHFVKPVHYEVRLKKKWVGLRWPTPSMAQLASMNTEAFENFYFDVCTLDYSVMAKRMEPLKALMERTKRVHIHGPGTDLRFHIEGIPAIPCAGEYNIPDGEIFTAPVRESVNGFITFNARTIQRGVTFDGIHLEFENGKIVKATADSNEEMLNEILDSDEGARYAGEFAIGVNPYITRPMQDILFDEKIAGSIHFTPGNAYEEADNGNVSGVHWDMVLLQDADHGGGRIYFDDELVRVDGEFVLPELLPLNPAELLEAAG
jgi:aminopeptidase